MATSSSIDFNLNAREVIAFALRLINITAQTEEPSAEDSARAQTLLSLMLKGWQKHEQLWRLTEGSITLVTDTASYSLSPVPHRVVSARYRDANSIDLPMIEMSREEYYDLPDKAASGIPTQYYVDYQRATVTVFIWPVPNSVTTETIPYTFQRAIEDIDDLANDLDIPQEHLEMVGYNLAARLADSYGRSGSHIDRIIARAEDLLNEALDDDREDFVQFVPDMRAYG